MAKLPHLLNCLNMYCRIARFHIRNSQQQLHRVIKRGLLMQARSSAIHYRNHGPKGIASSLLNPKCNHARANTLTLKLFLRCICKTSWDLCADARMKIPTTCMRERRLSKVMAPQALQFKYGHTCRDETAPCWDKLNDLIPRQWQSYCAEALQWITTRIYSLGARRSGNHTCKSS